MTIASAAPAETVPPRESAARERLLRVASELFYSEGITRVGMDRILREAGVTRATMYRHFTGKEQLVAAYLRAEDAAIRAEVPAPTTDARADLETVLDLIADDVERRHTRGCPFINAAAEYPDPHSEVRRIVREHRDWFAAELSARATALCAALDLPAPDAGRLASELTTALILLRDGALVGGYLDGPAAARAAFLTTAHTALPPVS